jgi:hypothetical protein
VRVEPNKAYITAGGYVVKLDYNCYAPGMSPGENDDYCAAGPGGWHWEKDGSIIGLTPEWMEKLKIVEECPFKVPDLPDGYKWAGGFPQFRIPKKGEYYFSISVGMLNSVNLASTNFESSNFYHNGKRFILEKTLKASETPKETVTVVKYYKHREKFSGEIAFIKRADNKYRCVQKNGDSVRDQTWVSACDIYVRDGSWIEISEGDALKLLDTGTTVPDASSSKKEEGNTVKKETALKVVGAVARFAGNWGFRALNYWVFEPAAGFGKPILKSVRYATFLGMVGGSVYGYYHPKEVKDAIKSCLPKITIEAPEIMRG